MNYYLLLSKTLFLNSDFYASLFFFAWTGLDLNVYGAHSQKALSTFHVCTYLATYDVIISIHAYVTHMRDSLLSSL
jgi:hypothetical protein